MHKLFSQSLSYPLARIVINHLLQVRVVVGQIDLPDAVAIAQDLQYIRCKEGRKLRAQLDILQTQTQHR